MVLILAPMTIFADEPPLGTSGEIIAFAPPDEEIEKQAVLVGGSIDGIYLPARLRQRYKLPQAVKHMKMKSGFLLHGTAPRRLTATKQACTPLRLRLRDIL